MGERGLSPPAAKATRRPARYAAAMKSGILLASAAAAVALSSMTQHQDRPPVGYSDTPLLPGQPWKVHDIYRPQPPVVAPAAGANLGAPPPADAIVLFDGKDASAFVSGDKPCPWSIENGYMEVNGKGSVQTRESFGDVQLHLEWASPQKVESSSQGRGNSGVFLMGRYEVQILDSFENRTYADGGAAALYGQFPPLVNASRAPGEWQSYDIVFRAPRFEGGELVSPALVTVLHNGVVVHNQQAFLGATRHRDVASYAPHEATGPIGLQDHGNPVRFRNFWARRL